MLLIWPASEAGCLGLSPVRGPIASRSRKENQKIDDGPAQFINNCVGRSPRSEKKRVEENLAPSTRYTRAPSAALPTLAGAALDQSLAAASPRARRRLSISIF